jgi:type IV pilus assembly protein PilM
LKAGLLKEYNGTLLELDAAAGDGFAKEQLLAHAVTIGAALTALQGAKEQVNFRQGEFAYPHPWKRLIAPLMLYFLLCVLIAAALYAFGQLSLQAREMELRRQYEQLLATMHKSHDAVEKQVAAKLPPLEGEEGLLPLSPDELTKEEIDYRVELLDKELKAVPDLFPLEAGIPKVSDLLAWLATHPNVVGKGGDAPLIALEGVSYVVIKRPELNKKQDKYQVKVELDFASTNPTAAREFHDALLAPNTFVDPKSEVKWTTQKGRYKATFLLKDRTLYP